MEYTVCVYAAPSFLQIGATQRYGIKTSDSDPASDLFRSRLENLIDMRHELVRLSQLIDWSVFESEWGGALIDYGRRLRMVINRNDRSCEALWRVEGFTD